MYDPDRPRLRFGLAVHRDERDPNAVYLCDQLQFAPRPLRLTAFEFGCVRLFDGDHSLRAIQQEAMRWTGGVLVPLDHLTGLASRLDESLFLDSPRFLERAGQPVREPSCIGCYDGDPVRLRTQLEQQFTRPDGPGLPSAPKSEGNDGRLCAALLPHIDYRRAGPAFAHGFKELYERSDAALFVIIGTSHYSHYRFTLTRKDFRTPLGTARTDQDYIDKLVKHYGAGLFDDELQAHLPEHSIELEVVFLQYLYEGKRPIRIVPLVVGSFRDCVQAGTVPTHAADVARMIEALRHVEAETAEPICYVISGDLAHIGPKFDDPDPVAEPLLGQSRAQDQLLLERAAAVDSTGYFDVIAREGDRRRICGLPPTYSVLEAARPRRGRILDYQQYVAPNGSESVSFASMSFYR